MNARPEDADAAPSPRDAARCLLSHGRGLNAQQHADGLRDDGVDGARRMDAVPEQILVRRLTRERRHVRRHARVRHVGEPELRRRRDNRRDERVGVEGHDGDPRQRGHR